MSMSRAGSIAVTVIGLVTLLGASVASGYFVSDTIAAAAPAPDPAPTPEPTRSIPPRPVATPPRPVPATCADAFDNQFWVLYDTEYRGSPEATPPSSETYPLSEALLSLKTEPLRCMWEDENQETASWTELTISAVTPEQSRAVFAELQSLGYYCLGTNGGINCYDSSLNILPSDGPLESWSDMHVLRDGLWMQVRAEGAEVYQVIRGGFAHAVTSRVFGVD